MLTEPTSAAGRGVDDEIYSPPPSHPLMFAVALGVMAVAAVWGMTWWAAEAGLDVESTEDTRVSIPDVSGATEAEAVAELEAAGFATEVELVLNVDVEPGTVISQTPRGGSLLDPGEVVRLSTSLGSGFVLVPEVTGTIGDQVQGQLDVYGLVVGAVASRPDMLAQAGEILEQSPAPGEYVVMGTAIDLVVSEGPPPVKVPDVQGLREAEARRILVDVGFTVVDVPIYSGSRRGTVVSTNPRAETEAEFGSEIRMFVSRGSAPTTVPRPTPPPTTAPTPTTTPPPTTPPPTTPPPTTPPPTTPPPSPGSGGQGGSGQAGSGGAAGQSGGAAGQAGG